jgi:hypothetical protein
MSVAKTDNPGKAVSHKARQKQKVNQVFSIEFLCVACAFA